ncbi:MAG: methionyl-tRNA formyltransferase [SAR86 cluster bacterium]|uniref:Methionyl-tRNA formyltransferase n=1 Tax=SAR86 cluster bacterium TaxID=2030880 RepID=A0A2A4MTL0_9GAMM|nr:MAG: methionyl-tRNA formyltransferase [SAR86 cluster bacterium]
MHRLNIAFAGTPAFAAQHLQALLNTDHNITAVYTQADRPSGRGKKITTSAVKDLAVSNDLQIFQPLSLKDELQQQTLAQLNIDLLVVVAYGQILPQIVLDMPKYGCINVHASLLPKWRGAAPIERAILAGDTQTGVTIMQMDAGLDTGAMLVSELVDINPEEDRLSLEKKLSEAGCTALVNTLNNFDHFRQRATAQDDSASSYARKMTKTEALLNWDSNAEVLDRQIRAGIGRHPAYSFLNGLRLKILSAKPMQTTSGLAPGTIISADELAISVSCNNSVLQLKCLQFPGKKAMAVVEQLKSKRELLKPGLCFSNTETSPANH